MFVVVSFSSYTPKIEEELLRTEAATIWGLSMTLHHVLIECPKGLNVYSCLCLHSLTSGVFTGVSKELRE